MMCHCRTTIVRALLMLLLAVGGCSHAAHYRMHHDGPSLYAALNASVPPGAAIEQVQELLGPGQEADQKTLEAIRQLAKKNPAAFPDGIEDEDTIISYPVKRMGMLHLQFRSGKLVNHDPDAFAKWEPHCVVGDA